LNLYKNLGLPVTELILGRERLGEESNYDYSKLKRKGKERESKASYFIINITANDHTTPQTFEYD
jgi:hypothetical protein